MYKIKVKFLTGVISVFIQVKQVLQNKLSLFMVSALWWVRHSY